MEYTVVEGKDDIGQFQDTVNEYIRDGWQPVGGVSVVYAPDTLVDDAAYAAGWWFYQAMIRKSG